MGEPRSSSSKWLWGCGIGCGVVLLLIGALCAGVFLFIRSGIQRMDVEVRTELPDKLAEEYAKKKEAGAIPAEHQALFDDLLAFTQREDASGTAILMASMVVIMTLDDDRVEAAELDILRRVRDFLVANPGIGWFEMFRSVGKDPDLQMIFQRMQMQQMEHEIKQREEQDRQAEEQIEDHPQETEGGLEQEQEAPAPAGQEL